MTTESTKSSSETIFRILAGLVGLLFLILGLGFMAFPDISAMGFSAQPTTIQARTPSRAISAASSWDEFFGPSRGGRHDVGAGSLSLFFSPAHYCRTSDQSWTGWAFPDRVQVFNH